MKKINLFFILLFPTLLSNCAINTDKPNKIAYSLPSRDPGNYQSPINILTFDDQKETSTHKFEIHFQDKITAVENLGHTIQLDFQSGSSITMDDRTYLFKQMHFHTPSEHLIDGVTYPMELHIVTANEQSSTPYYLVISILFKMGKENTFINEFLNLVPHTEHSKTIVKPNTIRLKDLVSASDLKHRYHYKGSLTTPPYTETVNWFVLKKIFEASPEQIKTINAIEGNNARHIESENNRLIEDN